MDEPFGALDPQIREMMQIELMKIWDEDPVPPLDPADAGMSAGGKTATRKTVLFVTHSVDEAVFLSDRVVMIGTQPGRVIADLAIDLPRPRWADDEALKRSPAFIAYRNDIWHMLKQQLQPGIRDLCTDEQLLSHVRATRHFQARGPHAGRRACGFPTAWGRASGGRPSSCCTASAAT